MNTTTNTTATISCAAVGNIGSNGTSNGVTNSSLLINSKHRQNKSTGTTTNDKNKKKFYPKLIATQIVAIQCLHYLLLTLLYEINAILFNSILMKPTAIPVDENGTIMITSIPSTTYMSLDHIFTDRYIHFNSMISYIDIITTIVAFIGTSYVFVIIVEKSKQCLDFAITLFICHIFCVTIYNHGSIPHTNIEWYIVHIGATIVMILYAEHLCAKRELDDIPLLTL